MRLQTLSLAIGALLTVCLTGCEKKDKEAISMDDVNKGIITVPGKDGKEYQVVDLGIGVYFATCNIGATSPEQPGLMFAWGELQPKEYYRWTNYAWNKENGRIHNGRRLGHSQRSGFQETVHQKELHLKILQAER